MRCDTSRERAQFGRVHERDETESLQLGIAAQHLRPMHPGFELRRRCVGVAGEERARADHEVFLVLDVLVHGGVDLSRGLGEGPAGLGAIAARVRLRSQHRGDDAGDRAQKRDARPHALRAPAPVA